MYWMPTMLGTALYAGKLEMNKRQDFCFHVAHILLTGYGKGKTQK